jgi:hypothetical protein
VREQKSLINTFPNLRNGRLLPYSLSLFYLQLLFLGIYYLLLSVKLGLLSHPVTSSTSCLQDLISNFVVFYRLFELNKLDLLVHQNSYVSYLFIVLLSRISISHTLDFVLVVLFKPNTVHRPTRTPLPLRSSTKPLRK